MNRSSRLALLLLLPIFVVAACAIPVDQPSFNEYGRAPSNYEQTLEGVISADLRDPDSAQFRFSEPRRSYYDNGYGSVTWVGYRVDVHVNAKNAHGGYTGFREWTALFSDGHLDRILSPNDSIERGRLRQPD